MKKGNVIMVLFIVNCFALAWKKSTGPEHTFGNVSSAPLGRTLFSLLTSTYNYPCPSPPPPPPLPPPPPIYSTLNIIISMYT